MAKIIEFYIPRTFQKKQTWRPDLEKGKIIEFCFAGKECDTARVQSNDSVKMMSNDAASGSSLQHVL